jgi:isopentenyl diphosphate isomerase/L-lactate dehydrogenase-like FMN-dependent dehydrogenase
MDQKRWGGKLILKGIMDAEDALAAETGADALIVSNHGGRQLDGAPATIDALPSIVQAAGRDIEVWLDSGIRSGQDVLKARALGAQGTLIGRSFLYGLGAYGQDGVTRALQIIQKELDTTMAFCGHTTSAASARTSCCRAPTRCRFCRSDTAGMLRARGNSRFSVNQWVLQANACDFAWSCIPMCGGVLHPRPGACS